MTASPIRFEMDMATNDVPIKTEVQNKTDALLLLKKTTSETTLHGIRYFMDPQVFLLRKLLWILIFIACFVFCAQQFYIRITRFIASKELVNLDIIAQNHMDFPRVVICNQNFFRITSFYTEQHLELFKLILGDAKFLKDQKAFTDLANKDDDIFSLTGKYVNLTEEYIERRHRIDDMLKLCTFRGARCNSSYFKMILTDYGSCYEFIGDGGHLIVTNPGPEGGLLLVINAEQYDYFYNFGYSAGLLMSIQAPNEALLMREKSLAVPVGSRTLIGLDLTEVVATEGRCSSKELKYHKEYSMTACRLECLTDYIVENCNCKVMYMKGDAPDCRVVDRYRCAYFHEQNFTQSAKAVSCDCPMACNERIYQPTLSHSPIADIRAKSFSSNDTNDRQRLANYIRGTDMAMYLDGNLLSDDIGIFVQFEEKVRYFLKESTSFCSFVATFRNDLQAFLFPPSINITVSSELAVTIRLILNASDKLDSLLCNIADHNRSNLPDWKSAKYAIFSSSLAWKGRSLAFDSFQIERNHNNEASKWIQLIKNANYFVACMERQFDETSQLLEKNTTNVSDAARQNISTAFVSMKNHNAKLISTLHDINVSLINMNEYMVNNAIPRTITDFDMNYARDNYVVLEVTFNELRYQSLQKENADTPVSLICDLGGTFGLCLGASLMTVYEIFDFCLAYVTLKCRKK